MDMDFLFLYSEERQRGIYEQNRRRPGKEPKRKGRPTHAEHLGRQRANSFESIIDSFKRKREEEKDKIRTEKELLKKFQKTRAVSRSPPTKRIEKAAEGTEEEKSTKNENVLDMDKIDKVTEIILTIKNDTDEIKKENKVIRQKIQDLREEWKKKQEKWKGRKKRG